MSRMHIGAALAVAALALAGTASADTGGKSHGHDRTIPLAQADKTLQPTFVDTGKPGPSAGDLAVIHDGVVLNSAPAGSYNQVCTLAALGSSPFTSEFECVGSITLKDGTITMAGPFVPAKAEPSAAITGGTGQYRTAHGEVVVRAEDDQLLVMLAR
jgi:hypothetical protein